MVRTAYFDGEGLRILAHRGLVSGGLSSFENTLPAFRDALRAGATHLETDVRATSDGVAVLFHDSDLRRTANLTAKIQHLNWQELSRLNLPGGAKICRLDEALVELPDARFNLDVKSSKAVSATANTLNQLRAHDRVLVSSFSEQRRKGTLALLDSPVATSASAVLAATGVITRTARLNLVARVRLLGIDALQVPYHRPGIKFADEGLISWLKGLGIETHFWTVNDPQEMVRLVALGASGIVTDRPDLVPNQLRS